MFEFIKAASYDSFLYWGLNFAIWGLVIFILYFLVSEAIEKIREHKLHAAMRARRIKEESRMQRLEIKLEEVCDRVSELSQKQYLCKKSITRIEEIVKELKKGSKGE